jgi:hypothetical protein
MSMKFSSIKPFAGILKYEQNLFLKKQNTHTHTHTRTRAHAHTHTHKLVKISYAHENEVRRNIITFLILSNLYSHSITPYKSTLILFHFFIHFYHDNFVHLFIIYLSTLSVSRPHNDDRTINKCGAVGGTRIIIHKGNLSIRTEEPVQFYSAFVF